MLSPLRRLSVPELIGENNDVAPRLVSWGTQFVSQIMRRGNQKSKFSEVPIRLFSPSNIHRKWTTFKHFSLGTLERQKIKFAWGPNSSIFLSKIYWKWPILEDFPSRGRLVDNNRYLPGSPSRLYPILHFIAATTTTTTTSTRTSTAMRL